MTQTTNRTIYLSKLGLALDKKKYSEVRYLLLNKEGHTVTTKLAKKVFQLYPDLYVHTGCTDQPVTPDKPLDMIVAEKYLSKRKNAEGRGLDFNLTLTSVRNLVKAKRCYYSGLPLNYNTMTIDRVDNSKGYVKGNVVACHSDVNSFKGSIEDSKKGLDLKTVSKILNKWQSRV